MKDFSVADLESKKNILANNAITRLSALLEQLTIQAIAIDKENAKKKSHWLIENNDLFSDQLFKSKSDCFTPYVSETKQRLRELSRLMNTTLISDNSEKIAKEITKKTKGYEFLANIITSDILRWNLKDLAAKDKNS